MISKLYDSFTKYIKENYKFLIVWMLILSVTVFLSFYEVDYEVYTPGSITNLEDRIMVEDAYKAKGSFNLTYVNAKPGRLINVLLSYVIPSWDLVDIDSSRIENEDYEEIIERGKIDLNQVNENAMLVAFDAANKDYTITNRDVTVYYVFEDAKTNLRVGDVIVEVNGEKISSLSDVTARLEDVSVGDEVTFKVKRDGKTYTRDGKVYESEGKKIIGMYLTEVINVKSDTLVEFNYKNNESGASGGLMSTLEIYNKITKKDITKGLTIAGTGTMNADGTVGEIGGVKYKLKGAVKKGADAFIVPTLNYEEAKEIKEKEGYDIKLIKADTFSNVLKELEKL